jgi:predicted Zn-dependent protease DUF2268
MRPAFCTSHYPAADCLVADRGRFVVAVRPPLPAVARKVGVALNKTIATALDRVATLLPGPRTHIVMDTGGQVIPGVGVGAVTDLTSGQVRVVVDVHQSSRALKRTLTVWLPVALAHEIDHSVRIQSRTGFGATLLDEFIGEGMSSAFDLQFNPKIDLPWVHAITASQERRLWKRARRLLGQTGLYERWFFGGPGIPISTGFQIGYHIVRDYLARHPGVTAASLVHTRAAVILSGSHYRP